MKKSEEEESDNNRTNDSDNSHPNAIDFSLFDDEEDCLIDG